jgi:large subunit ribosomal protein L21
MFAVIRTGGKQYRVAPEQTLEIERTGAEAGETITISDVLMIDDAGAVTLGTPTIAGAAVTAEVVALTRGPKIIIFKKKRRQNYRRKKGHRQDLMKVKITGIAAA